MYLWLLYAASRPTRRVVRNVAVVGAEEGMEGNGRKERRWAIYHSVFERRTSAAPVNWLINISGGKLWHQKFNRMYLIWKLGWSTRREAMLPSWRKKKIKAEKEEHVTRYLMNVSFEWWVIAGLYGCHFCCSSENRLVYSTPLFILGLGQSLENIILFSFKNPIIQPRSNYRYWCQFLEESNKMCSHMGFDREKPCNNFVINRMVTRFP